LRSHFFHDVYFRLSADKSGDVRANGKEADLALTSRILKELKTELEKRGGS